MSTHIYRIIDKSTHPRIFDCCFEVVIAAAIEASCTLTAVKIPMGEGYYLQRKQWRDGRKELPIFSPTGDFRSSVLKKYVILLTSSMQTSASRPPRLHTPPDPTIPLSPQITPNLSSAHSFSLATKFNSPLSRPNPPPPKERHAQLRLRRARAENASNLTQTVENQPH
jgi:hypothetical protein